METVILSEVTEESQAGEIRRLAQRYARALAFDDTAEANVSLVVTEAATNILYHGGGGRFIIQPYGVDEDGATLGLEILVLDKGSGMRSVANCLRDGFSTAGTQGTGLGAMRRLSNYFDIYSVPGQGTALLCRIARESRRITPPREGALHWGGISIPYPGEKLCGDMWSACWEKDRGMFLLVDGLGHGQGAAEAAQEAVDVFRACSHLPAIEALQRCDAALKKTRGAAAAISELDLARSEVRYVGVGNIVGGILTHDHHRHMVSHAGIVGHTARKFQEFTYPWTKDSILVMQSDGLSSRCDLGRYAGLAAHDPTLIAGVLFRDCQRGKDDATILVVKEGAAAREVLVQ